MLSQARGQQSQACRHGFYTVVLANRPEQAGRWLGPGVQVSVRLTKERREGEEEENTWRCSLPLLRLFLPLLKTAVGLVHAVTSVRLCLAPSLWDTLEDQCGLRSTQL